MTQTPIHLALNQVRTGIARRVLADFTDAALLERFRTQHDEAAFAVLLQRHGPMVLSVAQRILGDTATAEDIVQATFLVLARKINSIRKREAVGNWLYGVARRLALRMKAREQRRRRHERQAALRHVPPDVRRHEAWDEVRDALDRTLAELPTKYRTALVLCYLEDKTHEEAAQQLGCPLGTMRSWVARGRQLLQRRLRRQGLALSLDGTAAYLACRSAEAALPAALCRRTLKAALCIGTGENAIGLISTEVATLVKSGMHNVALSRLKMSLILAVSVVAIAASAGGLAWQQPSAALPNPSSLAAGQQTPRNEDAVRVDRFGDALPPGALARIGTTRWRLGPGLADTMLVTPDGKQLLAANSKHGITVFDLATGRRLRTIPSARDPHPEWLSPIGPSGFIALSPDGRTAAFSGNTGPIYVVDIATARERCRCPGHRPGPMNDAAFSADGRTLVTRGFDATLRVWDTTTGRQIQQLDAGAKLGDPANPPGLGLSANGTVLAWTSATGVNRPMVVHVSDTRNGLELQQVTRAKDSLCRIALSPDGHKLLVGGNADPAELRDLPSGRVLGHWPARAGWPPSLAFAPDSKTAVLNAGLDGMRLLDSVTGKQRWCSPRASHSSQFDAFGFSPNGKVLFASQGWPDHVLHRYDMATGKSLDEPPAQRGVFADLVFAPDGRHLYGVGGADAGGRTLRFFNRWDVGTGRATSSQTLATWAHGFAPNGRLLVGYGDGVLHIYATATTKELRRLDIGRAQNLCLAFSSDSRLLAADFWSGKGACVAVWELATGKQLCRIDGLSQPPVELSFTPDGKRLLGHPTRGVMPNLRLYCWDVATGRECKGVTLPAHWGQVRLGPDGRILAVPADKSLDLWELATMQIRASLPALRNWPSEMAFSADGALFLVADTDGAVLIYDAYTGRLLGSLTGHRGQVVAFAFSPGGRRLATASQDTTALIWDLSKYRKEVRARRLLSKAELTKQWQALAAEASTAGRAMAALRATPDQAIPFLRQRIRPFRARDTSGAARWIRDLDSARFTVREKATRELAHLGESVRPILQQALAGKPAPEARRRLKQVLDELSPLRGDQLRELRAVELLEQIGTPEAQQLLVDLAHGAPSKLTEEAQTALARLARHAAGPP